MSDVCKICYFNINGECCNATVKGRGKGETCHGVAFKAGSRVMLSITELMKMYPQLRENPSMRLKCSS